MNNQPNTLRKGTRRFRNAILTWGVILAVLALNIAFSFVADRGMWQVDETVTRYTSAEGVSMYTNTEPFVTLIRDSVVPMVEKMNEERAARGEDPITINIKFCSERDKVYAADKLRMIQYTAMNLQREFPDAVKVEYLNIEQNPSQVQKYKATSSTNI